MFFRPTPPPHTHRPPRPALRRPIVNRSTWLAMRVVVVALAVGNITFRVTTDMRTVPQAWVAVHTPLPVELYPFASFAFTGLPTLTSLAYSLHCIMLCELLSGVAASLRANRCKVADATWLTVLILRRIQSLNRTWGIAATLPVITLFFEAIVTFFEAVVNGRVDTVIMAVSLVDFLVMLPAILVCASLVASMTDLLLHANNLRRLRVLRALRLLNAACSDSGRLLLLQELTLCDGLANTVATSNMRARVLGVPISFGLIAKLYTLVASALYLFGRIVAHVE